ncbi:hypothetical protein FOA52_010265 [Chlamydomonas sp. UWO 241]|nr:hypothetical protein FOA52_010265 [Chlamydomonas sp. UWO 241]
MQVAMQRDPFEVLQPNDHDARLKRVQLYRVREVQRRLADCSAQVEAAALEVRHLLAWKARHKPRTGHSQLTDDDRATLEASRRARVNDVITRACGPLLKLITGHKWAFPFLVPVDTAVYTVYLSKVKEPMDLGTIKARLEMGYYKDPKDFWADLNRVFDNAKTYNARGTDCFLMAQTLQEVAQERYDKTIAPRLQDEARAARLEEQALQWRRAATLDAADAAAVEAQCARLLGLIDELTAQLLDVQSEAAALVPLVGPEEKQALLRALQALPTSRLEAVVAFVASRQPHGLPVRAGDSSRGGAAASGGQQQASGPPKVSLMLSHYDAVLLRQLQHLAAVAAPDERHGAEADAEGAACSMSAPAAGGGAIEGQQQAAGAADAMDVDTAAAATAAQPAPSSAQPPGGDADMADAGAAAEQASEQAQAQAAPSASASAQPLTPSQAAPPNAPVASRLISSDVVTRDGSRLLQPPRRVSTMAGVAWPGLVLSAGCAPLPRARADTADDLAVAMAAAMAADKARRGGGGGGAPSSRAAGGAGLKRKAPTPIQVEWSGGLEGGGQAPVCSTQALPYVPGHNPDGTTAGGGAGAGGGGGAPVETPRDLGRSGTVSNKAKVARAAPAAAAAAADSSHTAATAGPSGGGCWGSGGGGGVGGGAGGGGNGGGWGLPLVSPRAGGRRPSTATQMATAVAATAATAAAAAAAAAAAGVCATGPSPHAAAPATTPRGRPARPAPLAVASGSAAAAPAGGDKAASAPAGVAPQPAGTATGRQSIDGSGSGGGGRPLAVAAGAPSPRPTAPSMTPSPATSPAAAAALAAVLNQMGRSAHAHHGLGHLAGTSAAGGGGSGSFLLPHAPQLSIGGSGGAGSGKHPLVGGLGGSGVHSHHQSSLHQALQAVVAAAAAKGHPINLGSLGLGVSGLASPGTGGAAGGSGLPSPSMFAKGLGTASAAHSASPGNHPANNAQQLQVLQALQQHAAMQSQQHVANQAQLQQLHAQQIVGGLASMGQQQQQHAQAGGHHHHHHHAHAHAAHHAAQAQHTAATQQQHAQLLAHLQAQLQAQQQQQQALAAAGRAGGSGGMGGGHHAPTTRAPPPPTAAQHQLLQQHLVQKEAAARMHAHTQQQARAQAAQAAHAAQAAQAAQAAAGRPQSQPQPSSAHNASRSALDSRLAAAAAAAAAAVGEGAAPGGAGPVRKDRKGRERK